MFFPCIVHTAKKNRFGLRTRGYGQWLGTLTVKCEQQRVRELLALTKLKLYVTQYHTPCVVSGVRNWEEKASLRIQ